MFKEIEWKQKYDKEHKRRQEAEGELAIVKATTVLNSPEMREMKTKLTETETVLKGTKQIVNALVPMAEMLRYAPDLNSMTGGRGTFSMEFETYEELPHDMAQKVIEKTNAENEKN